MKYPDVRKLYKYRSLRVVRGTRSVRDKKLIESISSRAIWIPNPENFNDPFDCNVRPISLVHIFEKRHSKVLNSLFNNPEQYAKKIALKMRKQFDIDYKNTLAIVSQIANLQKEVNYEEYSRGEIMNGLWEQVKAKIRSLGVLSLSEIPDHPLLWSHYADQHRGFCIEFERIKNNKLGDPKSTFPVRYSNKYPHIAMDELFFHNSSDSALDHTFIGSILLTKSEFWSYESEWRMIGVGNNILTHYPGKVLAIIFGLRMPIADRNFLKKLYGQDVQFKETLLSEDQFLLTIRDVE